MKPGFKYLMVFSILCGTFYIKASFSGVAIESLLFHPDGLAIKITPDVLHGLAFFFPVYIMGEDIFWESALKFLLFIFVHVCTNRASSKGM